MSSNEKKDTIVIGVDFGATFSAVAWCYTRTPEKIKTIRWPGATKSLEKVPSVVQYSSRDASKYKWGFRVTPESSTIQAPLRWFKLLLNKHVDTHVSGLQHTNRNTQLGELYAVLEEALPKGKTPIDVVTDYLKGIYTHTLDAIKKDYPENFSRKIGSEIPLRLVLTVPAAWSEIAKEQFLHAARAAGMDENYAKIALVSEPKAAVSYCLKVFKETAHSLEVGDVYVIADCGGRNVGLVSYEITAVEPDLCVNECVVGSGGLCGSTELNLQFESLVKSKIGKSLNHDLFAFAKGYPSVLFTVSVLHIRTSCPRVFMVVRHFDEYLKPTFCPPDPADEDDGFDIETYHCPVPGVEDSVENGICSGNLVLSPEDMKWIFHPTFSRITRLVQNQVITTEKTAGKAIAGVLLVGGFGSSPYLHKHLSATIKDKQGNAVKILQPEDAWTAIVHGAVLYGLSLNHGTAPMAKFPSVDVRCARGSYGVQISERFDPRIHPVSKIYVDPFHGDMMCARMEWFVKKGEEIPNDFSIKLPLPQSCEIGAQPSDLIFSGNLYFSSLDSPPADEKDPGVKSLLTYTVDLNGVPRKKYFKKKKKIEWDGHYWEIPMCMLMNFQSASLEFSFEVGGYYCGKGSVEYNHEEPQN